MLYKLTRNRYLKSSVIFFIGSMVIAVLNYAYYPILSRLLSVEDFGSAQTIATIILQSTIILNAFGYVAIHLFTNTKDKKNAVEKGRNLEGAGILITLIISFIALILSPLINRYLKFESQVPLLSICLIFVLNVPFTVKNSWLQAKHKFVKVSVAGIISATTKIIFSVLLIVLGLKVIGVVSGLVIATLASVIYVSKSSQTGIRLSSHLRTNYFSVIKNDQKLKQDLFYSLVIFVTIISVTLLYSADIIFVRRFFSETIAGYYGGIAAVARIIFFATFAFSAVLLPSIEIGKTKQNNRNFFTALMVTTLVGGMGVAIFYLIPDFIIKLLIGGKFLINANLLGPVSLFVLLASITNVVLVYLLAMRKKTPAIIGAAAVLGLVTAVNSHHQDELSVIQVFIITNLIVLIVSLITAIIDLRINRKKISN